MGRGTGVGESEPPILYPIPTSALSFLHQDVNNDVFGCETFRHIGLDSLQQEFTEVFIYQD